MFGTNFALRQYKLAQLCDFHCHFTMLQYEMWITGIIHTTQERLPLLTFLRYFYAGGDKLEHQKNNQIRKGWRILHQYFCLYPGGNDYGGIYLKCVPHHIRKAGNGSYFRSTGKTDPVKRTNADTGALFSYLAAPLSEVEGLTYQVTSCGSTNRIQIGTPFYVTVTGRCYLGGFWKLNLVPIDIKANGAGVSEHYWK